MNRELKDHPPVNSDTFIIRQTPLAPQVIAAMLSVASRPSSPRQRQHERSEVVGKSLPITARSERREKVLVRRAARDQFIADHPAARHLNPSGRRHKKFGKREHHLVHFARMLASDGDLYDQKYVTPSVAYDRLRAGLGN